VSKRYILRIYSKFAYAKYSSSGVPIDRQKLVVKGNLIKEDKDFELIKDGQQIMLMGSSDTVVAPKERVRFLFNNLILLHLNICIYRLYLSKI